MHNNPNFCRLVAQNLNQLNAYGFKLSTLQKYINDAAKARAVTVMAVTGALGIKNYLPYL